MKTIKITLICVLASMTLAVNGNKQEAISKIKTIKFKVSGVCTMCKDRIETITNEKGVRYAIWDLETKMLTVSYSTKKTTEKKVRTAIANLGHDNAPYIASDKAYNALHSCCKYRTDTSH